MITPGINGLGADLSYRLDQDVLDVLGPERVALIDEVVYSAVFASVHVSYAVAVSGALRWTPAFRPEVLIDATGRLL